VNKLYICGKNTLLPKENNQIITSIAMRDVKIKIHQLGMIGESEEITLNRLMIFSGESGLGKSYLSIICHYIFSVLLDRHRISLFFEDRGLDFSAMRPSYKGNGVAVSFPKKEFEEWLSKDAIQWLGYMVGNKNVKADIEITLPEEINENIVILYEEDVEGLGNEVETYIKLSLPCLTYRIKDSGILSDESPFAFLFRYYLIQEIFEDFKNLTDTFIFPPSRGMMLTEDITPITGMYVEFKQNVNRLVASKTSNIQPSEHLTILLRHILDGSVKRQESRYIYTTNGEEMPLSAAAASIRELASIEFLIENSDISKSAIMIDEPEAHLHPLKQRMMADIISSLMLSGAYIQVTTHSDYFLRRINELSKLHELYERSKERNDDYYVGICDRLGMNPELHIDNKNISAYLLVRNGEQSIAIKQDMSNGVPFAAFHDALKDTLRIKNELERELNDGDN
jgi:hypothetical protein